MDHRQETSLGLGTFLAHIRIACIGRNDEIKQVSIHPIYLFLCVHVRMKKIYRGFAYLFLLCFPTFNFAVLF